MQEQKSIFNLQIDESSQFNLIETAKWARFLGIIGMVMLGIMLIAFLGLGVTMLSSSLTGDTSTSLAFILAYAFLGILYVYPVMTLFKFGKQMKIGINENNQAAFNNALNNLKNTFRFIGIVTIIIIAIYIIVAIFALVKLAANF